MNFDIRNRINHIYHSFLQKADNIKAAVAVVVKDDQVLLGKSTLQDERRDKLVFPGGHIEEGEGYLSAAVRELKEEAGVEGIADELLLKENGVAFVKINYESGNPKANHEFFSMGWYPIDDLPEEVLEQNKEIIEKHLM